MLKDKFKKRLSNENLEKLIKSIGAELVLTKYMMSEINILENQLHIILNAREDKMKGHGGVNCVPKTKKSKFKYDRKLIDNI